VQYRLPSTVPIRAQHMCMPYVTVQRSQAWTGRVDETGEQKGDDVRRLRHAFFINLTIVTKRGWG